MNAAVLMMLGCMAKAPPEVAPYSPPPRDMAKDRPSGVVHDGVFTDEMYRFSLPIVEGWVAQPGPETGLMRVVLQHVATETRVEVWAFSGEGLEPGYGRGVSGPSRPRGVRGRSLTRSYWRRASQTMRHSGAYTAQSSSETAPSSRSKFSRRTMRCSRVGAWQTYSSMV